MSKLKLTKGELKRQRDSLRQFERYLPTLQLKKQQLQIKILEARLRYQEVEFLLQDKERTIRQWLGVLADPILKTASVNIDFHKWIIPTKILVESLNIAGTTVPVFKDVEFEKGEYDLYTTPFWVDRALMELRAFVAIMAEMAVIRKQITILEYELRITTQRVNLFEKIKIPECKNNIRIIRIYLGDQMANAVGIGKVAKKKLEIKTLELTSV